MNADIPRSKETEMNSVSKTAGMAGFLYFIYRVIHVIADASQQKTAGVAGADQAMNYSRPVFQKDTLGRRCRMKTISLYQNKIQQRRRNRIDNL